MIGFTAPWALLGLAAAAIPLLLHLFARREPPTVLFPATRYLAETARARHRRLTLQHWILLLLRTVLVAALALAAAGPTLPSSRVAAHAPTAVVVVIDNSLSSAVTVEGTSVLDRLRGAVRDILRVARPDDALWLVAVDGIPRRGGPAELASLVDRLTPEPRRLDLGDALGVARETVAGQSLPGVIVLASDLQATAVSAIPAGVVQRTPVSMLVVRPEEPAAPNLGIAGLLAGRQPWGPEGGRVTVTIAGAERSAALAIRFGERPPRQQLVGGGASVSVPSGALPPGWWPVRAELEPDELRLDDVRQSAVRVAPPTRARWGGGSEERFLGVAGEVLVQNGRLVRGTDVTLGSLGPGPSIVQPPSDPAGLGALNRALAARGVAWRYGDFLPGSGMTDSSSVLGRHPLSRRYALIPAGGEALAPSGVLLTAGGAPWLVKSGAVLLLGSRLEPDWTELPLAAEFVPFVDFLANRAVRGELALLDAAPGDPVPVPGPATSVSRDGISRAVEGGEPFRPPGLGLYYFLRGPDTLGVLAANPDPRESDLTRARDAAVRQLWPGARVVAPARAGVAAFAVGSRADLRGPLLLIAALLALGEAGLAGGGGLRGRRGGRGGGSPR